MSTEPLALAGVRAWRAGLSWVVAAALTALLVFLVGCDRAEQSSPASQESPGVSEPLALDVDVRADSGASITLDVTPPTARVWVESVRGGRSPAVKPAPPAATRVPLPDASPDTLATEWPAAPALAVDAGLKPPLLRRPAILTVPAVRPRHPTAVELDVLVDERGAVTEVAWAGGEADAGLVEAAITCARSMEFYPALRGTTPVAVWCRQRFDFGGR